MTSTTARFVQAAQLAGAVLDIDLDHRHTGAVEIEVQFVADADRHEVRLLGTGAAPYSNFCKAAVARRVAGILDAHDQRLGIADHAIARRALDDQPAVAVAVLAGEQEVQRRVEAERGDIGRHVVHLAVGHHDDAGEPLARYVDQGAAEQLEQPRPRTRRRAGGARRRVEDDGACLEIGDLREARGQRVGRRRRLVAPRADRLARRIVDHDDGDVGQQLAHLLDQRRVDQRAERRGETERAPPGAARPALERHADAGHGGDRKQRDQRPRHERRDGDRGHRLGHWPSRSRIAGKCT